MRDSCVPEHSEYLQPGRPLKIRGILTYIEAPTLLIVGGDDGEAIDYNRWASEKMDIADKELKIIPGASNLFEEQGALE